MPALQEQVHGVAADVARPARDEDAHGSLLNGQRGDVADDFHDLVSPVLVGGAKERRRRRAVVLAQGHGELVGPDYKPPEQNSRHAGVAEQYEGTYPRAEVKIIVARHRHTFVFLPLDGDRWPGNEGVEPSVKQRDLAPFRAL